MGKKEEKGGKKKELIPAKRGRVRKKIRHKGSSKRGTGQNGHKNQKNEGRK